MMGVSKMSSPGHSPRHGQVQPKGVDLGKLIGGHLN